MTKEINRKEVLEMMLSDGFTLVKKLIGPHMEEYEKGTIRLIYDIQRDVIIKTYEVKKK